MRLPAWIVLASIGLLGACARQAAYGPCPPPIPPEPPLEGWTSRGTEYDPAFASRRLGALVIEVYTPDVSRPSGERLQTPAQVSLTAFFAEGFLAHVWRATTDSLRAAVFDSVLAGQYVLAVQTAQRKPFRKVVTIRSGYTDTIAVQNISSRVIMLSCPPL